MIQNYKIYKNVGQTIIDTKQFTVPKWCPKNGGKVVKLFINSDKVWCLSPRTFLDALDKNFVMALFWEMGVFVNILQPVHVSDNEIWVPYNGPLAKNKFNEGSCWNKLVNNSLNVAIEGKQKLKGSAKKKVENFIKMKKINASGLPDLAPVPYYIKIYGVGNPWNHISDKKEDDSMIEVNSNQATQIKNIYGVYSLPYFEMMEPYKDMIEEDKKLVKLLYTNLDIRKRLANGLKGLSNSHEVSFITRDKIEKIAVLERPVLVRKYLYGIYSRQALVLFMADMDRLSAALGREFLIERRNAFMKTLSTWTDLITLEYHKPKITYTKVKDRIRKDKMTDRKITDGYKFRLIVGRPIPEICITDHSTEHIVNYTDTKITDGYKFRVNLLDKFVRVNLEVYEELMFKKTTDFYLEVVRNINKYRKINKIVLYKRQSRVFIFQKYLRLNTNNKLIVCLQNTRYTTGSQRIFCVIGMEDVYFVPDVMLV
jgi:hypothetical protein